MSFCCPRALIFVAGVSHTPRLALLGYAIFTDGLPMLGFATFTADLILFGTDSGLLSIVRFFLRPLVDIPYACRDPPPFYCYVRFGRVGSLGSCRVSLSKLSTFRWRVGTIGSRVSGGVCMVLPSFSVINPGPSFGCPWIAIRRSHPERNRRDALGGCCLPLPTPKDEDGTPAVPATTAATTTGNPSSPGAQVLC